MAIPSFSTILSLSMSVRSINFMKLQDYLLEIEQFVKDYLNDNHMEKYILGLSGGVDSSLVAGLTKKAVGKDKLLCVLIPIDSNPADESDAKKVAEALDVNYIVVDGSKAFHALLEQFENNGIVLDKGSQSNLKVRIRMCILYAYAQQNKGLVIGTDNACENYTGYFTKYGDGGVDIQPIVYLLKEEVVEAAKLYGVPPFLAERVPTAGLFEGQTDESEMGIKYKDIDTYLLGGKVSEDVKNRIEHLHHISNHKRDPIPHPKPFIRD